jgi:hypothetical protein
MDEIKKILNEKIKETEENISNSSIGVFLLKTHEDVINNMEVIAHDMAINSVKRYLMLMGEYDGMELLLKVGGDALYNDENFKSFIKSMNQYFEKIKNDVEYNDVEEYKENENKVYNKFKLLFDKVKDSIEQKIE